MFWRLRHKLFGTDFVLYKYISGWDGARTAICKIHTTPNGRDYVILPKHGHTFLSEHKSTVGFSIHHLTREDPCEPNSSRLLEQCPPRSSCSR